MKLSEILAKPIKLIGGGLLNLKGFNKSIIDKEIGGGDDFPFEYYCSDDFSVIVNPEDWDYDDYPYAEISIPESLQVPENHKLISGSCNDAPYIIEDYSFYPSVEQGKKHYIIRVRIDFDENIFYIMQQDIFDPSEVGPITLNFKDFFFLGNKK